MASRNQLRWKWIREAVEDIKEGLSDPRFSGEDAKDTKRDDGWDAGKDNPLKAPPDNSR